MSYPASYDARKNDRRSTGGKEAVYTEAMRLLALVVLI
jgi:hypothetical protein